MEKGQEITAEYVVNRATEAAVKLTDVIDRGNEERHVKPLIESRDLFVFFLASQFAKMMMGRMVIGPIKS